MKYKLIKNNINIVNWKNIFQIEIEIFFSTDIPYWYVFFFNYCGYLVEIVDV